MPPSNIERTLTSEESTMHKKEQIVPSVAVGARCYIPDETAAWLPVYVEEVNEQKGLVTVRIQRVRKDEKSQEDLADHDDSDRTGESRMVAMDIGFPLQNAQLSRYDEGLDNMIDLNHLHEAAILRNLKKRFRARRPYTYTGDICLAINPYQWLDEQYTPGLHKKYLQASKRHDLPPHVYAVSVAAFRHMCDHGSNQSILVSGESGAGKTETTKILMDNLAIIAPAPSSSSNDPERNITTRIIQVNPLLESFGNAKTTRNDNSSRFGKFTQLQFDKKHAICGAQCETYLLEKTRVVSHEQGERNYHIFYQLLRGTTPSERDALGLGDECMAFSYLKEKESQPESQSGRMAKQSPLPSPKPVVDTQAEHSKDQALFAKTRQALTLLGLGPEQQNDLFKVLSGILHLGEARFTVNPDNDEACDLDKVSVTYSSTLLGLDPVTMAKALTHRTMKAAGEVYLVPLTVEQAQSGRDALAKAIYASIFDWLVAGINASLGAEAQLTANTIGVLDIFGFESFERNSFEQLCINYANEKLQQKFTRDVFRVVQEEYEREQITWAHISYADNSDTLALIESRMGVLALLNEEIVRPRGNEEGFVSKLSSAYLKQKKLIEFPRISKTRFAIHHYAGTVEYEATGFLEKHKDALLSDLSDLMCGSHEPFPQMLFKVKAQLVAEAAANLNRSQGSRKAGAGAETVGMQFKKSLNSLMDNINETNVNYIRCIKPNSVKSSTLLEDKMVANQLRCAGVIEAICIARAGYPNQLLHAEFAEQFDLFLKKSEQVQIKEEAETYAAPLCRVLVQQFELETPEEYQMGVTKIYLQKGVLEKLEHAKARKLFVYVALIQAHWRGMQTRCKYHKTRDSLIIIQQRAKAFVDRCRFLRAKAAIAMIQRVYRGHLGRCEFHALLCEHRALQIQCTWRGYQGRKVYRTKLHEVRAVQIQRVWRGYQGRKAYLAKLHEVCTIQIQRVWRGRRARHVYFAVLCQVRAVRLQCFARQYLARQELARRRMAYMAELDRKEQERVQRELELAKQRKLEEERERERQLQEELARAEEERRLENERLLQVRRRESALLIQKHVRGYFARCLFAVMVQEAEEEARRRRQEEDERERIRLQREHEEREAQRLVEEEREKERLIKERKEKAIAMRQRRENAVTAIQRIVRGHLARVRFMKMLEAVRMKAEEEARRVEEEARRVEEEARRVEEEARKEEARREEARRAEEEARREEARREEARWAEEEARRVEEEARKAEEEIRIMKEEARKAEEEASREEEAAAIRLQSIQRGRLARQQFSAFKIEVAEQEKENVCGCVKHEEEIARVREEHKEEIACVRDENVKLKQQLAVLQRSNQELEAMVAEYQRNCNEMLASNDYKKTELMQKVNARYKTLDATRSDYSSLCSSFTKSGSSRRSTETEDLNLSDSSSSGEDDDSGNWRNDRPAIDSTTASSYFDGNRSSTDVATLFRSTSTGTRTSRLANAMQQRRLQASQVVQQRKLQASIVLQQRKEEAAIVLQQRKEEAAILLQHRKEEAAIRKEQVAQSMHASATNVSKAMKSAVFARMKVGRNGEPTTPNDNRVIV